MDHIHRLSREHHELTNGKFCNASELNSKSLTTEERIDNRNFNGQTSESSLSNRQAAVSDCDVSGASNCEVYSPASSRTHSSKIEVVAAESKLGTANLMTSAQKCSDLISKPNAFESNNVSCLDINLSVPDKTSDNTKTECSTLESPLIKRKLLDLSFVTQLGESKSKLLGFRSRDVEHKSSLNGVAAERANKLRGN
jgi:hypothetical protein